MVRITKLNPDEQSQSPGAADDLVRLQRFVQRMVNGSTLRLDQVPLQDLSKDELLAHTAALRATLLATTDDWRLLRQNGLLAAQSSIVAVRLYELRALQSALRLGVDVPSTLTPEQARGADDGTRLAALGLLRARHANQEKVRAALELALYGGDPEPTNLLVIGPPFVGKTDTIHGLKQDYDGEAPRSVTINDPGYGEVRVKVQTVVYAECPHDGRPKSIMAAILRALGAPRPDRGTASEMIARIVHYVGYVQARVLAVDDINFCVQRGERSAATRSPDTISAVAQAFRELLACLVDKHLPVALVLLGTEPALRLRKSPQFGFRFREVLRLDAYPFGPGHADESLYFLIIVNSVLHALPLAKQRFLDDSEERFGFLSKIHYACAGNVGLLVDLTRAAAQQALALGAEDVAEQHFAYAFDVKQLGDALPLIAGNPRTNPFVAGFRFPAASPYARLRSVADLVSAPGAAA